MALHRAPNQFSPGHTGGPVTPSCCGCCCCCCCAGSAVATSIALPLILSQLGRAPDSSSDAGQPAAGDLPAAPPAPPATAGGAVPSPDPAAQQTPTQPPRRPATGPARVTGLLLAALALPIGLLVLVVTAVVLDLPVGALGVVLAFVVAVGVAAAGYRLAGVTGPSWLVVPGIVTLLGCGLMLPEVFLWGVALLSDDATTITKVLCGLAIVAIPLLSTGLIITVARRRRRAAVR